MEYKDTAVAAISKDAAAEFSDLGRGLDPTLRFCIKFSKLLQLSIFFSIQKLDPHRGREINSVASRMNPLLFSRFLPCPVVTNASAAFRALRGAVIKNVLARLFIVTNNVRLAAGDFHCIY